MVKQKLILYSWELTNCPCYPTIFNDEYEYITAKSEKDFINSIHNLAIDAAIICFCSASEDDVDDLLRLDALSGPITFLTCSKILNPEFVRKAAQKGIERFLICNMETEKIKNTISEAIREARLKNCLGSLCPDDINHSPHINKLINEIIYTFPRRVKVEYIAEKLGIDRGWLYKLCKDNFDRSPTALVRRVWIYQALRMMQHTNLNNLEIAMKLNYTEESSMAREFRKELGYSPNAARKQLIVKSPEELLH